MKVSICIAIIYAFFIFFFGINAKAVPAFARRENVSCNMCHANGAPHLTEFGYMYRRMAFHWPGKLGDEKQDENGVKATNHFSAGVNLAYSYADNTSADGVKTTTTNGVNVPEVEVWPVVGGFMGNWGVWSEIDSVPQTNTDGGVKLSMADLRYASGNPDLFFNFRGGMISPEGFGASDQWSDDANLPLMDLLSANKNQDTLVKAWGAMGMPELGFEFGLNYQSSHLTLGIYDGFTNVTKNADGTYSSSSELQAATTKSNEVGMRDIRLQLDQFIGTAGAITAGYYQGTLPLMDPIDGKTFSWLDHYSQARLYFTAYAVPSKLDLFAGLGWAKSEFVSTNPNPDGSFENKGGFLGASYYVMPHLTLSGRLDQYYFTTDSSATGYSLQVSLPYENRILIFHLNHTASALASANLSSGWNNDIGFLLRFLL